MKSILTDNSFSSKKLLSKFFSICLLALLIFISDAQCQTGQLPPDIVKDFVFNKPEKPLSGRLAFTAKIGSWQRIFSLDLLSGKVLPVITGPGNNFYPTWSPDGEQLAFVSDRDGNKEIYLATWYGENLQRLTNSEQEDDSPDWSGNSIFYSASLDKQSKIAEFNLQTKQAHSVTNFDGRDTTPRLAPDGKSIAYSTSRYWPGWDICIYNMASRIEACPLGGKVSHCRPYWSKDGNRLLYAIGDGQDINIGLYDIKKDESLPITKMDLKEYDPIWGPDEKSVFFVAESKKTDHFDIYIKVLDDRDPKPLLTSPYSIRYLSWVPRSTLELEAQRIRGTDTSAEAVADPSPQATAK